MKLFFLTFLLFSSTLFAQSKVIIAAFKTKESAQKGLELYKQTNSYKKMFLLRSEDNFKIYTRPSGKYFVLVAEKFHKKEVAQKVLHYAQEIFKKAYLREIITKTKKPQPKHTTKIDDMMIKNGIAIFFTLVIFFTILYYARKFKRIYDQY